LTAHSTNGFYLLNATVKDVITEEDLATISIILGQDQADVLDLLK